MLIAGVGRPEPTSTAVPSSLTLSDFSSSDMSAGSTMPLMRTVPSSGAGAPRRARSAIAAQVSWLAGVRCRVAAIYWQGVRLPNSWVESGELDAARTVPVQWTLLWSEYLRRGRGKVGGMKEIEGDKIKVCSKVEQVLQKARRIWRQPILRRWFWIPVVVTTGSQNRPRSISSLAVKRNQIKAADFRCILRSSQLQSPNLLSQNWEFSHHELEMFTTFRSLVSTISTISTKDSYEVCTTFRPLIFKNFSSERKLKG